VLVGREQCVESVLVLVGEQVGAGMQSPACSVERICLSAAVAMDGLLDILRRNKKYRQVEIRRLILGFLVVLGDENPQTRAYRAELTGLLF